MVLDLREHCVETAARKRNRELAEHLLRDDLTEEERAEAAAQIRILESFAKGRDFRAMRAQDPELAGGAAVELVLWLEPDGRVRWEKRPVGS